MTLFSFIGKELVLKALNCVLDKKVTGKLLVAFLALHVAISHAETPASSAFAPTIPNKSPRLATRPKAWFGFPAVNFPWAPA